MGAEGGEREVARWGREGPLASWIPLWALANVSSFSAVPFNNGCRRVAVLTGFLQNLKKSQLKKCFAFTLAQIVYDFDPGFP